MRTQVRDDWAAEICGKMQSGRNASKEDRGRKISIGEGDQEGYQRQVEEEKRKMGPKWIKRERDSHIKANWRLKSKRGK